MNIQLAEKVLTTVARYGVAEFCICAGARNSPFVFMLDESSGAKIYNFFDERSAAFFALGRIQATGKPVAVITTSGTAVAELLPATVEAYYSELPLLLITADRPRHYRGSGAPQSIEQVGIFSHYVQTTQDLADVSEELNLSQWTRHQPLHVNVCFSEPLIDQNIPKINFAEITPAAETAGQFISAQTRTLKKPLVVVGALKEGQQQTIVEFLRQFQAPIYAEAISGLRGNIEIQDLHLTGGEKSVQSAFEKNICASVLRLGGVPTLRFWRDLEDKFKNIPVYSVSDNDFTGLSRAVHHLVGYKSLHLLNAQWPEDQRPQLFSEDLQRRENIENLLRRFPQSEPALIAKLLNYIGSGSVYVGNSLPIREVDLVGDCRQSGLRWLGNRGANGIDGQISTFLGWCAQTSENWRLVGDLTALYDLSSLWIAKNIPGQKRRIVVVNNSGGQIFKNIFKKEAFLNRHEITFQKWAEMWGWSYQRWSQIPNDKVVLADNVVIELVPQEPMSDDFWAGYSSL